MLDALSLQRSRFECSRGARARARESQDLLLLAMYAHIPPSRGLEFRSLEVIREGSSTEEPFSAHRHRNRNIALFKRDGSVVLHVQLYKTSRFTGHDEIELPVSASLCVN